VVPPEHGNRSGQLLGESGPLEQSAPRETIENTEPDIFPVTAFDIFE
jgi:hypothetical protein